MRIDCLKFKKKKPLLIRHWKLSVFMLDIFNMTCVLSVTSIHTFSTDNVEIDRECCETICFDRLSAKNEHLSPNMCCKCLNKCQTDDKNGRSIFYRSEISNERLQAVEYQNYNTTCFEDWRNNFSKESENKTPLTSSDQTHSKDEVEDCNKTGPETNSLNASPKHGIKRKFELTTLEEEYVPPKRVSPNLNTQKERKDDRKKILKLSIKKLKDLDDPETFLRRTVLVNNTMKRLQVDLQEEHEQTKGFKSLRRYGVPGNMCKSDLYLFDDPFLIGVNEKITDDMTDTLISNVFENESDERTNELAECESSEVVVNETKCADTSTQLTVDSRLDHSSGVSGEHFDMLCKNDCVEQADHHIS